MTERRRGLRRAALLAGVAAMVACSSYNTEAETHSNPRVLDRICRVHACVVEGKAVRTHGITDDSIGFHLGPGPGRLVIPVTNELELGEVEALVTGTGSFAANAESCEKSKCKRPAAPSDYAWVSLGAWYPAPVPGGSTSNAPSQSRQLVLQTIDEHDELDVADIRSTQENATCAIVGGPGFRR